MRALTVLSFVSFASCATGFLFSSNGGSTSQGGVDSGSVIADLNDLLDSLGRGNGGSAATTTPPTITITLAPTTGPSAGDIVDPTGSGIQVNNGAEVAGIQDAIDEAVRLLEGEGGTDETIGDGLTEVVGALSQLTLVLPRALNGGTPETAVAILNGPLQDVVQAIAGLVGILKNNVNGVKDSPLGDALNRLNDKIINAVKKVLADLRNVHGGGQGGLLVGGTGGRSSSFDNLVDGITKALNDLLGIAQIKVVSRPIPFPVIPAFNIFDGSFLDDIFTIPTNGRTGNLLVDLLSAVTNLLKKLIDDIKRLVASLTGKLGPEFGVEAFILNGALNDLVITLESAQSRVNSGDARNTVASVINDLDLVVGTVRDIVREAGGVAPGSPLADIVKQVDKIITETLNALRPMVGDAEDGAIGEVLEAMVDTARNILEQASGTTGGGNTQGQFSTCGNSNVLFATAEKTSLDAGDNIRLATATAQAGTNAILDGLKAGAVVIGDKVDVISGFTSTPLSFFTSVVTDALRNTGGTTDTSATVDLPQELLSFLAELEVYITVANVENATVVAVINDAANLNIDDSSPVVQQIRATIQRLVNGGTQIDFAPLARGTLTQVLDFGGSARGQLISQLRDPGGRLDIPAVYDLLTNTLLSAC